MKEKKLRKKLSKAIRKQLPNLVTNDASPMIVSIFERLETAITLYAQFRKGDCKSRQKVR